MTTTLLGKVVITPGGAYDSDTAYDSMTAITYGGSSYLTLQPVQGVAPLDDGVNYQSLAQGGSIAIATFNVNKATGELVMNAPDAYTGPQFSIDASGHLEVNLP